MTANAASTPDAPADVLRRMIMGFRSTQLLFIAARLELADLLADAPLTVDMLARRCGATAVNLRRVLRALAALGVFEELEGDRFGCTTLSEGLRWQVPGSLAAVAALYGDAWLWHAYGEAIGTVCGGPTGFEAAHGMPLFEYLDSQPAARAVFDAAMAGFSAQEAQQLARAFDFGRLRRIVDVGGGSGRLVAGLLAAHPHLEAIVFDRPDTAAAARRALEAQGMGPRVRCIGGDFFEGVPPGGDAYLLKSVLHDWDDSAALRILRRVRAAMAPGALLIVAERLLGPALLSTEARLFDFNMMVVAGGVERGAAEFAALFARADLALERVIPTDGALSLVLAQAR